MFRRKNLLFAVPVALALMVAGHFYIPPRKEIVDFSAHADGGAADGAAPVGVTWPPELVESADECRLLARVLQTRRGEELAKGWPVVGDDAVDLRCDWPQFNVEASGMTVEERRSQANMGLIQPDGSRGFVPVVLLGKPRYSLLRTRALVETGIVWNWLGGHGEKCLFTRTFTGWRLERCVGTWIA